MVRGRLFYRRAASVPVSDYRLPLDTGVTSKAYLISSHAAQDTDAMTAKSRRNDSNFLNDVSNKMAIAHLPPPYQRDSTYIGSRYPVAAIPYSYNHYPYTSYPNHYYPSDYRNRTWYAPPVSDYEVDSYLSGGPKGYYGRYSRAGSVPPVLPSSTGHVPRWHSSSSYARGTSVPRWNSSAAHRYPYGDVAVGVAHTSQYGDIVIGIPYNKKHLVQNNNHYKGGNNYKSHYYPSFANRHSIANNYPSVGAVSVTPSYRRASIAVPYVSAYDSAPYYSGRGYDSGYEYWPTKRSGDTVATVRGRAQSVQKQLQGIPQFQFYDSVAPADVTITRPRAASSVPTFRAAGASTLPSSSLPAASKTYSGGYSGGSFAAGGAQPVTTGKYTKAPVSETRRKVRDLLCKSKKDPHYFD